MSFVFDGTEIESADFNGTELDSISINGVEVWGGKKYLIKDDVVNNDYLQGTKFTVFEDGGNFVVPTGYVSRSLYTAITCPWGEWNDSTGNYVLAQAMYTPNTFVVPSNATKFVIEGYATNAKCLDNGSAFYLSTNKRSSKYSVRLNQNGNFTCEINVEALRGQSVCWIVVCYRQSDSDTTYGLSIHNVYFE